MAERNFTAAGTEVVRRCGDGSTLSADGKVTRRGIDIVSTAPEHNASAAAR